MGNANKAGQEMAEGKRRRGVKRRVRGGGTQILRMALSEPPAPSVPDSFPFLLLQAC